MAKQLLIDNFGFKPLKVLTEGLGGKGKYTFEGTFGQTDKPTSNGRIYSRPLMMREFKRLENKISQGKVLGELDHPDDGKTKLQRAAVLIQSLGLNENGEVVGRMTVMDTPMGKTLKAIVDAGGQIGVSSRGYGSVQTNEDGYNVVQDDFKLLTYDPVSDPAEESAYPSRTESDAVDNVSPGKNEPTTDKDEDSDETKDNATDHATDAPQGNVSTSEGDEPEEEDPEAKKAREDDKKEESYRAQLVNQMIQAALREQEKDFQANLAVALRDSQAQIRVQVESEFKAQSKGAEKALNEVKSILTPHLLNEDARKLLSQRDAQVKALSEQLDAKGVELFEAKKKAAQMTLAAKEMGFNLFLERSVARHPQFDKIVESLGEFSKIQSLSELKRRTHKFALEAQEFEKRQKGLFESLQQKAHSLSEAYEAAKAELAISLETNMKYEARIHLESLIVGNKDQVEIREEFAQMENRSQKSVERLVKKYQARQTNEARDFTSVRRRIERQNGGFTRSESLVEDHIKETFPEDRPNTMEIMGESIDLDQVNKLAGFRG